VKSTVATSHTRVLQSPDDVYVDCMDGVATPAAKDAACKSIKCRRAHALACCILQSLCRRQSQTCLAIGKEQPPKREQHITNGVTVSKIVTSF
jgi:hypothetical protein